MANDDTAKTTSSPSTVWALGDYDKFAKHTVWELGPILVQACDIRSGMRVLDVAAGTGNVAIRAAKAGADVVASDLTRESLDACLRSAEAEGVTIRCEEADAESLPFDNNEFDVVTTCFGAIFAPNHRRVADELLRVCKPGGRIGMINFTPEGLASRFFGVLAPYMPPSPPDSQPPLLWGSEQHVRSLFADRVSSLEMTRRTYVERADSPEDYMQVFKDTFGPVVATYASLQDQPERLAELERDFSDFVTSANTGSPGDPAEYEYEYLLVVAKKR